MNHYIDSNSKQLFAYDDEQVAQSLVKPGLIPCEPRPSALHDWIDGAWQVDPMEEIKAAIAVNSAAIQAALDEKSRRYGYDNILTACSYAVQVPATVFQTEGVAFLQWRSDVWEHAFSVLEEVKAGTRPMPAPEEAVAMMPLLNLPPPNGSLS